VCLTPSLAHRFDYAALFTLAHRALCAAAIRFLPAAEIVRSASSSSALPIALSVRG